VNNRQLFKSLTLVVVVAPKNGKMYYLSRFGILMLSYLDEFYLSKLYV